MAVQTTYDLNLNIGFAGMKASSVEDTVTSYLNEDVAHPFGVVVRQGTGDQQTLLPSAAGQDALGVVVHTHAWDNRALSNDDGVENQCMLGVMRKGEIYVRVEDAVSAGGQAFFRHTAPGTEQLGALRSDAAGGNAEALGSSRFKTSAAAGELAVLEINLP